MGVQWPSGFSQASMHVRLAGHATPYVITLGIADTSVASPDVVATNIFNIFKGGVTGTAQAPFNNGSMNNSYTFEKVVISRGPSSAPLVGEHSASYVGTGTNAPLPPMCSVLVKKNTGLGGRHGRGRLYMPACSVGETQVDAAGVIAGAALASNQTDWSNLHTALTSAGHAPFLFHDDASIAPTAITSFSVQPLLATQRRRLR